MPSDFGQLESLLTMGAKAYNRSGSVLVQNADRLQLNDFPLIDIRYIQTSENYFIWAVHEFGTHKAKVGR